MTRIAKVAAYTGGSFIAVFVALFVALSLAGSFITLSLWTPLDDQPSRCLIVLVTALIAPLCYVYGEYKADGA